MTKENMQIFHNNLTQQSWDDFVLTYGPRSGSFLQSWSWGEFQKSVGKNVDRLVWMSETNEPVAIAQVLRKTISGFGTYAYIPRGPVSTSPLSLSVLKGGSISSEMFVRMELAVSVRGLGTPPITEGGQFRKTIDLQPAHTLITNLSQTEEHLFANMHEKTRYNIRLAEKKGVKIEIGTATIDEVWPVFEATAVRDEFRLHGKEYYRKMIETSGAFIAIAKHENDLLAVNIMMDFGETRTYLHGASSNVKRNFMGPFLLHAELMKDAKSVGIRSYDWWGVAPVSAPPTHAWAGISRFKRGFGGEEVEYPGTFDLVLHPIKYKFYQLIRLLRRKMG